MNEETSSTRRPGLRIGRVFGVPVIVSPTWLILAVLVTVIYSDIVQAAVPGISGGLVYVVSFGFVVTLCVSVFLHELGHALVSRHYGIEVRSITLEMLGGHTEMASEAQSPKVEAAVALAGPLVSAVLGVAGVAALALTPPGGLATQFAFQIAASNIIVAVYNALPGMPLDGGRALRALVWAIKGDRHLASRVAGWTGRAVAVATGLGGALLYFYGVVTTIGIVFALLIAAVLWLGATRSIQIGQLGARFHLLDVRSLLRPAAPVTTGTPLAEALRRMREAEAVSVVVVGSNGEPLALLSGPAARAVPEHRRPWIPVDDVSRAITPETAWDPRWRGDEVVDAMRRHHAPEYAVMFGGRFEGLVRASDIADVLDPRRPVPTTGTAAPADTGTVPHRQEDDQT